jgi:hypothetical protein
MHAELPQQIKELVGGLCLIQQLSQNVQHPVAAQGTHMRRILKGFSKAPGRQQLLHQQQPHLVRKPGGVKKVRGA